MGSAERRRAIAAAREWFRDPNVLAIGIGKRERRGRRTEELAVVATVLEKPRAERVPRGYRVPRTLRVPETRTKPGFEIKTDVVVGHRKRFATAASGASAPLSLRIRPEGHGSEGTLGGVVRDSNDTVFLLSCSHVLSDFGRVGTAGVPIVELERGRRIARLRRYLKLVPGARNYADVAIAELMSNELVGWLVARAPIRSAATRIPVTGDDVLMFTQASTPSRGTVSQIDVEERVYGWASSDASYVVMAGQIEVEGLGVRGDSGAVVTDAAGRAVGLFVADNGAKDLMTPIARVLRFAGKPDLTVHAPGDTAFLDLSFVADGDHA